MKNTTPVSEVMSPSPISLAPNDTMDVAECLFEKHGIHHLPVTEGGRLLGIVSHTDLLKITRQIFGDAPENLKNDQIKQSLTAAHVMQPNVICLAPSETLGDALRLLATNRFHALPVIEGGEKRLVGIVTTAGLLSLFGQKLAAEEAADRADRQPAAAVP